MNVFLDNDSWVDLSLVNDTASAENPQRVYLSRIGPGTAKSERQKREPTSRTPEAHVLNTRNSQASRTAAVTI